ncbi:MAG TPA: archaetidylserine decarboxylase [Pseudomonadales bacterium]|nr:archaetidylserine decarboxylase [Pseudomonadales bacterium]
MTFGQRAFLLLQHLLPKVLLTRFGGFVAGLRIRALRRFVIRRFIAHYGVAMHEAANPDPDAYGSFNEFFTRRLREDARPMPATAAEIASPCDGTVSEAGPLDGTRVLQAKGVTYAAADLLGDAALAERFRDGAFATIYLSPRDYHRVHMPADGVLERMIYVPGGLYSVNPATVAARRGLFARNERIVSVFRHPSGASFAMVLVGAMVVGGIRTTWAGRVTPRSAEPWNMVADAPVKLARGDEMGLFELGSTVILIFEGGSVGWRPELAPGAPIRLGRTIGRWLEPRAAAGGDDDERDAAGS